MIRAISPWIAALVGLAIHSSTAMAGTLLSNAIVTAIRRGDCSTAIKELNSEANSTQSQTALFVGGRMLDEGICVKKDPLAASQFFERSTELGDSDAALDYAAKIGLGEGTQQDYQRAGDACHKAGLDPQGKLSFYSLGYACTVRGVAGRLLRETLPKGAFRIPTAPAIVEFRPSTAEIRIQSAPKAERGEARTGSLMGTPLVDARQAIEKAWGDALAAVPKPDAASLGTDIVSLSLDVDMTLEAGRNSTADANGQLLPGDFFTNRPAGQGH